MAGAALGRTEGSFCPVESVAPPSPRGPGLLKKARPFALPAAVGALALALRLYGLGDKPFWLDEIFTLHRATATLQHLVGDSLRNYHYPSYFLLLWLVAKLGTSQWLLRLPSALFGAAAAALTCAVGRRVAGAGGGAAAGLLMALSPFAVQMGQEARPYTLACCLIMVALWGLVRLAQEPAAAAIALGREGAMRSPWIAYGGGTAAALGVLNVAIPWFVAANLAALAIGRAAGGDQRGFWRNWGLAQLLIVTTWMPLTALMYFYSKGAFHYSANWAPAETAGTIWSIVAPVYLLRISSFITFGLLPAGLPALAVLMLVLAPFGCWRLRREPTALVVLASAALVLPLTLLLVSLAVPVLAPRYFAWSAAPFFILAGAGLGSSCFIRFAPIAAALGAACLINLAPYYGYETKPRWDLLASDLAASAKPGDVVVLDSPYSRLVLSFFAARAGLDQHRVILTWRMPEAVKLASGHNLWAVYGRVGLGPDGTALDQFRSELAAWGRPVSEMSVGSYIVLWRLRAANAVAQDTRSRLRPAVAASAAPQP